MFGFFSGIVPALCDEVTISMVETYSNRKVTFALAYSLLVSLPLMRSAGLWHVRGLLPPQALTKLVHFRGHVLPVTVDTERDTGLAVQRSPGGCR